MHDESDQVALPALKVSGLRKAYGSTRALDGVSVDVRASSVHALLGENGAGKSTLVKILSGLAEPDDGTIELFGETLQIESPHAAHQAGIRTAFQEISLVEDLTVAQNFMLMEEPRNLLGLISRQRLNESVSADLHRLGLGQIDPRAKVATLDLPTRQVIEIARSVSRRPKLLLLDEPTASLSSRDVEWLAGLVADLKAAGTTIIFISHRMQEVREFCDTFTILRNGTSVGTYGMSEIDDERVIEMMIGRSLAAVFPEKQAPSAGRGEPPALAAEGLESHALRSVSFDLWKGQVLGIGGLQGMGQRELFLSLFGAAKLDAGKVILYGNTVQLLTPADAVAAGIGLVPEDRKTEGLFLGFTGSQNLALPSLDRFASAGLISERRAAAAVLGVFDDMQIPPRALTQPAMQFSGGNQQKMALAKWLLAGSRILLLYDPTRGVDIGTKAEIYKLINKFAADGGAVLFYSSEIAELVNLCTDVVVLYRGRVSERLTGDDVNETMIMRAALGHGHSSLAALETA